MTARILEAAALAAIGILLVALALAQERPPVAPQVQGPRAASPQVSPLAPVATKTATKTTPPTEAELRHRATVVARFGGGEVTIGELEDAIRRQSPYMRRRYLASDQKRDLLDKTVRLALLAKEAERRGYGNDDAVAQTVKQNAVQALMKEEIDDKITLDRVPAEDVKKYYQAHLEEFVRPATRRVSHVMFATAEEAEAALAEAREMDMRQFRELARQKSIDEQSNARGGDLGYFDAQGKGRDEDEPAVPPPIVKAAFALKEVGDVAATPVKIDGGYSLVKLTGQRPASERSLEDADATIRTRLWREQRQAATEAFVEKLRAEHKPVVHAELLNLVSLAHPAEPDEAATSP